ncbi:hypothetical protein G6F31_016531 [Rhizopus arrhizus]|nr:hypothetical protein G6F31_016531 [Rhizopus arrhizus]
MEALPHNIAQRGGHGVRLRLRLVQRQRNRRQGRQALLARRQRADRGGQAQRRAHRHPQTRGSGCPQAGQAGAGERGAPGQVRPVQRLGRAIAEQARRLERHQRHITIVREHGRGGRRWSDPAHRKLQQTLCMRQARIMVPGQRQIQLRKCDALQQVGIAGDAGFDPDLGMRPGELAQYLGQQRFAKVLLQAQPYPAFQFRPAHGTRRLIVQRQQPARVGQHRLARLGQRQAAAFLAKQRHAGLLFQLLQLRADGGHRT